MGILVFAYKAEAAHSNFHFRWYSLPIHGFYLISAFVGWYQGAGAYCNHEETYPRIFLLQYAVFYNTYVLYFWLYRHDFFITWDKKALTQEQLEATRDIDDETRIKTQARMI